MVLLKKTIVALACPSEEGLFKVAGGGDEPSETPRMELAMRCKKQVAWERGSTRLADAMLFTPRQAARLWGIRIADLDAMAVEGTGPSFVLIRGARRYPLASMSQWIASRRLVKVGAR